MIPTYLSIHPSFYLSIHQVKLELLREISVDNAALLSELQRERAERQRWSAEAEAARRELAAARLGPSEEELRGRAAAEAQLRL